MGKTAVKEGRELFYPFFMIIWQDTCTIKRRNQKLKLSYASGSAAFHVGAVVTGASSGATATIDKITGSTLTGYLVLREVTGTFQTAETITDNQSPAGSATTSAAPVDYVDGNGSPEYYWTTYQTGVPCRFYSMQSRMQVLEPGEYKSSEPWVMFPPNVLINETEYLIVSTATGYSGTYQPIGPARAPKNMWGVDHYEWQIKEVV